MTATKMTATEMTATDCVQTVPPIQRIDFRPHPVLRGGHLQTFAGFYLPCRPIPYDAEPILVDVSDGDQVAIHDDRPLGWSDCDPSALIIHGLAGCHESRYVAQLAHRLVACNIRTFRMDMRGTGLSRGRAKLPGHAGRTEDVAAALECIATRCPDSSVTMVGFSMGGNVALGTLADAATQPIGNLTRGIAVAPPVDLSRCCNELRTGTKSFYDRYLIQYLVSRWQETGGQLMGPRPRSIYQFDDQITAPLSGFLDAEDYYERSSSGPRLKEITLPTRILAAEDDPVVSCSAIERTERSPSVELFVTESGGHLGYVSSRKDVDNRRWMDRLLEEWVCDPTWT